MHSALALASAGDLSALPTLKAYLERLPLGLDSHSSCTLRADIVSVLRDEPGYKEAVRAALPGYVADVLLRDKSEGTIPEIYGVIALAVWRDAVCGSDEAYLQASYQMNQRLLDRPVFRTIIRMLSPALMLTGSTDRWTKFHQGTTLQCARIAKAGSRSTATLTLTYPQHLFPRIIVAGYGQAYKVGIDMSGANESAVRFKDYSATRAVFELAWFR